MERIGEPGGGPFVARDEEMALILAEIGRGATETDRPSGVVVVGAPGVGKTRLADEVARAYEGPLRRVVGTRATRLTPFGAVAPLAPGRSPRDFDDLASWYGAVRGALGGGQRPLPLLVVDDAHLLDAAGSALLLHLVVTASATVVATVRHGEWCPDAVTALWRDGHARRVDLQPFSATEAEALIASLLPGHVASRTVHQLIALCGGNALFIREVVIAARATGSLVFERGMWRWSGAVEEVPRLVDAVEQRMGTLDDASWTGLATIALGEPRPVRAARSIIEPEVLTRLETRGLIEVDERPDGASCSCVHPLYGEIALHRVGFFERRRVAGALAEALAESAVVTDDLRLSITRRRLEAGQTPSGEDLLDAAVIAADAFDFALAEDLARAALADGTYPRAAIPLARALVAKGDAGEGEEVLARFEAAILTDPDPEVHRRYVDTRFNALHMAQGRRADVLEMLERFERAPGATTEMGRRDLADLADAYRARVLVGEGRFDEVLAVSEAVRARPDAPGLARLHALQTAGEALAYQGRTTSARAIHAQMWDLAATGERDVRVAAVWAGMQEVLCLTQEGRVDDAADFIEPVVASLRTSADLESRGLVYLALAAVRLGQGRPSSARACALDALDSYRGFDPGGGRAWALALLAQAEALRGDVPAAVASADECAAYRERVSGARSMLDFALADAYVAMAQGRATHGAQILIDAAAGFADITMSRIRALHRAATLGADPAPLVDVTAGLASGTECALADICAAHVQAMADHDAAALEQVAERFADLGLTLRAAEAAAQAADRYRATGVRSGAIRTSARCHALLDRCEGADVVAITDLATPPQLSRREREVARVAVAGKSNRQIADELSISVRTVESHLYNVFAKLGVSDRSALASVLSDPSER